MPSEDPPSRLARRLGTVDATLTGLGSMVGAGVFVVFGLAARAAGGWLLVGLVLAAVVAICNALSSAQLAAVHPGSGGTYLYGRERLGPTWGFLAGGGSSSASAPVVRPWVWPLVLIWFRVLPRQSPSEVWPC